MRQVILDTETTGLSFIDGDRVIEVAAVEFANGEPTGRSFYSLINPERDIPAEATEIHGLTNKHVESQPIFAEIVRPLLDFCRGAEVIAHNAHFDVGMINNEISLTGSTEQIDQIATIIDSLRVARAKHPKQKNDLDTLGMRYEVDLSARAAGHNAKVDCEILGRVYAKLIDGVDLSVMDYSVRPDHEIKRVQRTSALPKISLLPEDIQANEVRLNEIEQKGVQVVARRPRM